MLRLRNLVLSAVALIGLSGASAQAGCWRPSQYRTVCETPIVTCSRGPCPVVTIAPVCASVVRTTHYRTHAYCRPRVVCHQHCR
jgi:hypothetical protein